MFSKTILVVYFLLSLLLHADFQLYEGDKCMDDGNPGVCCSLNSCSSAYVDIRNRHTPTSCSFEGFTPIVCCHDTCSAHLVTESHLPDSGTVTPTTRSPDPNKRKSEKMCEQYENLPRFKRNSEYYHFQDEKTSPENVWQPDTSSTLPAAEYVSVEDRLITTTPSKLYVGAVVGGTDAIIDEFPHMAGLGWPLRNGGFTFRCGGSLISDRFVLTAGHCLHLARDTSVTSVEPTIVRLGDLNILDKVPDGATPVDATILTIIRHPNYRPPLKYNDIALLELQESVVFSNHVRPACLWTKPHFEDNTQATVPGWGTTVSGGRENSGVLQKVTLDILETNMCQMLLQISRNRNWQGFRDNQICVGVLEGGKSACQGDSGGPLQIKAWDSFKKYYLIGVSSFGRCAKPNLPGVYTRVSSYIDWIEAIVWP